MKPTKKARYRVRGGSPSLPISVGVAWYTEENWKAVKAHAIDADRFECSYPKWLEMAEEALRQLLASGILAKKTFIKAEELLAWCLVHNKANSAASRAEYVSQIGRKESGGAV